jgi:hypothetical protein
LSKRRRVLKRQGREANRLASQDADARSGPPPLQRTEGRDTAEVGARTDARKDATSVGALLLQAAAEGGLTGTEEGAGLEATRVDGTEMIEETIEETETTEGIEATGEKGPGRGLKTS